ncbi:MAG TPA: transposase [Oscillatoriales cyanobacterium M59_W2019_021]|nr:MAG: transposase [Cyanobacteria bacterium J055]HIK30249.1 transposase [Oscillatoriales cyanobacterium M4454_W2019_049]HIK53394.1 transposase [Oscillatoriales cyanobacterium M59_W2019_021]
MTDLTPLINFLKGDRDPREYRRALAVRLALTGHTHREINSILGVSSAFVSKWKAIYEERGIEALKLGYKGHPRYLSDEQKQEVVDWILTQDTWNISQLRLYLFDRFGVAFKSRQSYYALLRVVGGKLAPGELEKMDDTLDPL